MSGIKIISKNRKAFHNYEIGESYEAGLSLMGTEVKALRVGKVNLSDGWVEITAQNEAMLNAIHIGHYSHGNIHNHDQTRRRKLLLHKKEIARLGRAINEQGFTIVPLKIYFKGSYVKIEIALGKGKKSHDKRHSLKEKDVKREISGHLKKGRV